MIIALFNTNFQLFTSSSTLAFPKHLHLTCRCSKMPKPFLLHFKYDFHTTTVAHLAFSFWYLPLMMLQLTVMSISPHCYYRVDISLGRRVFLMNDCQTFLAVRPIAEAFEADWNMES